VKSAKFGLAGEGNHGEDKAKAFINFLNYERIPLILPRSVPPKFLKFVTLTLGNHILDCQHSVTTAWIPS